MNEIETVKQLAEATKDAPLNVGFTWGAAAGWSTFVVVAGTLATILRSMGPTKLYEIWVNRDAGVRKEKREKEVVNAADIAKLQEEQARLSGALAFLANAVTTAVNALASDDHAARATAASQARELVAMAVSTLGSEDPFGKALERLSQTHRVDPPRS